MMTRKNNYNVVPSSPSLLVMAVVAIMVASELLLLTTTSTSTTSTSTTSVAVAVAVAAGGVVDAYAYNHHPPLSFSSLSSRGTATSTSATSLLRKASSIRGGGGHRILLTSLMPSPSDSNDGGSDGSDENLNPVSPMAARDDAPALPIMSNDNNDDDVEDEITASSASVAVNGLEENDDTSFASRFQSSLGSFFNPNQNQFDSAMLLVLLDVLFRRVFQASRISFPSSLGGMMILLAAMLSKGGNNIYKVLAPGAGLLAKWLPVFFVPSLITLLLIDGSEIGGPIEIAKILAVIVGGFFFTLLTTAGSVMKVGSSSSKSSDNVTTAAEPESTSDDDDNTSPSPAPKVFSDELMKQLRIAAITSGVVALEAASPVFPFTTKIQLPKFEVPLINMLLGSTTLASFAYGSRMSAGFKKVVHPLVTCTLQTWAIMGLFAKCVEGGSFTNMLTTYKMGNGIKGLFGTGAGDVFLFLLGPAVLSLSVSMYEKRNLIRDNAKEVATATAVSTLGGLFGTALMVRMAKIMSPQCRVALISRNITSPLAMAISRILGADPSTVSLAVGAVVVTGLIGANFGASILSFFGIGEKNAVARGMGIGAAAHGLGTAAFAGEKDAFPFAAISMALTATACTVLVSIPVIKNLVLAIALGGM